MVRAARHTVGRALLLAAFLPAADAVAEAAPPAPLRVALRTLRAEGVEPSVASFVQSAVCTGIGRQKDVEAVCPEDLEAAAEVARASTAFGTCTSDECLKKLEEVAKADRRVTGEVSRSGDGLVLTLALWEGEAARPERKISERIPSDPEGLLERIPEVVRKLFQ